MSEIKIEYKGEEITFWENSSQWQWDTTFNVDLGKVKAAIDRARKVEFERVEAYYEGWSKIEKVTVTSCKEDGQFWTVNGRGERRLVVPTSLYACTPENEKRLAKITELEQIRDKTNTKISAVKKTLDKFKPPAVKSKAGGEL